MNNKKSHKPTVETLVNTAALAIITFGVTCLLNHDYYGFLLIVFGMGLEFFKYYGRNKEIW